ncbi:type II secretion system minor pseudopilin GspI [Stutzerimonas nitrititolerans]|uniref:type II secretion system minor pseudopilin GspI n=1 Tax=Stutzerimonas nitrititolerans TaxID=2482751 RepID=UPI0028A9829F|nr:type II secretion system minor pseudopilin GspI [Stutzerimonas nitrititolerans]
MHRNPCPRQLGFTLIEVLVALAIVAIAISAAVRAVGLMTNSNALLRDKSLALLAAESRMAEIRLAGPAANGARSAPCDQGRLELVCEEILAPTEAPALVRIIVNVRERAGEGPPLARLESLLSRQPAKGRP